MPEGEAAARAAAETVAAYERAIGLESDPAVRRFLERRRAELRARPGASAPVAGVAATRPARADVPTT
jgi:hypothetical protein